LSRSFDLREAQIASRLSKSLPSHFDLQEYDITNNVIDQPLFIIERFKVPYLFLMICHPLPASASALSLRNKLEYTTTGFQPLPSKFSLGELQTIYEAILGKTARQAKLSQKDH
jgi:hypothetical protein